MTTTRRTLDTATVPLAGGREFTAALYRAADGKPLDLVLSVGYSSDGHGWRAASRILALPPESLREIRRALEALEGVGE